MAAVKLIALLVRDLLAGRAALAAENLALRQQLIVLSRSVKRPKIRKRDRVFWVWLSRLWSGWRSSLLIVQPATVVKWRRQGFKLYWRWKSRGRPGRPKIDVEIQALISRMSHEDPTWGVPRIESELQLLGYDVAPSTIAKYMKRLPKPPSQTWRTFLSNHAGQIVAADFFTVPTVRFQVLYVSVLMRHHHRHVVHFNVTAHPTAEWTAQQVVEAFPYDQTPRFLVRDRDSIYGHVFRARVAYMGIEQIITAYRSPWQNACVERLIGSRRRECVDHFIALSESHLARILTDYFDHYHHARPHLSLDRSSPIPRQPESSRDGQVMAVAYPGGLHHRYTRAV